MCVRPECVCARLLQVREDESNLTSPPPEPSSWSAGGMQRFNEQASVTLPCPLPRCSYLSYLGL